MATALRFTFGSTTVDFTDDEVRAVSLTQSQQTGLINNQVGAPHLHTSGSLWHELSVQIAETARDTKTRINQIISAEQEMACYYQYAYSASTSINVLLIPDNIRKAYYFGEDAYGVVHGLTFMQTDLP